MESAGEVLIQSRMDEPFESILVKGVKCFLLGIRFGRPNADSEMTVTSRHAFALALFQDETVKVGADVHHTIDAGLDAQQVHFVQHDASTKPTGGQILVVPARGEFAGEMRLDQHCCKIVQHHDQIPFADESKIS